MFNDKQKQEIAKAVFNNLGQYKCPMCGEHKFSIIEEFGLHMMRPIDNPSNVSWGVPYIMLICGRCGYMSQHNAISLGIVDANMANEFLSAMENLGKTNKS